MVLYKYNPNQMTTIHPQNISYYLKKTPCLCISLSPDSIPSSGTRPPQERNTYSGVTHPKSIEHERASLSINSCNFKLISCILTINYYLLTLNCEAYSPFMAETIPLYMIPKKKRTESMGKILACLPKSHTLLHTDIHFCTK